MPTLASRTSRPFIVVLMTELEDHTWFPAFARRFQTAFIGYVVTRFNVYAPFLDHLRALPLSSRPMFDLCSGSGEPAISIFTTSGAFAQLTLSDKFPDASGAYGPRVRYLPYSVDVLGMRFEHGNVYTMFNALHHFSDAEKLLIVQRIRSAGATAYFVEILEPGSACLLKVFLATTVGTVLLTPFVLPFSWWRLFFTYIVPLNVFTIPFDGVISVLRSRSAQRYRQLFLKEGHTVCVTRLTTGIAPLVMVSIEPSA